MLLEQKIIAMPKTYRVSVRSIGFAADLVNDVTRGQGLEKPVESISGGAFNAATHVAGLTGGLLGTLISRIGNDSAGGKALEILARVNADTRGIQIDAGRPTGEVDVVLHPQNQVTFSIESEEAAWAHMDMVTLEGKRKVFYYCSLVMRALKTRAVMFEMLRKLPPGTRHVFDINLRLGNYERDYIKDELDLATDLKINAEEVIKVWLMGLYKYNTDTALLNQISRELTSTIDESRLTNLPKEKAAALQVSGFSYDKLDFLAEQIVSQISIDELTTMAKQLAESFPQLKTIALTLADRGSRLIDLDANTIYEPRISGIHREVKGNVVGAGDAWSAMYVLFVYNQWNPQEFIDLAHDFSFSICQIHDRVPEDATFYDPWIERIKALNASVEL